MYDFDRRKAHDPGNYQCDVHGAETIESSEMNEIDAAWVQATE